MQSFTDADGRTWEIKIDSHQEERLHARLGLNLADALTGDLFLDWAAQPAKMARLAWILIEPQAESRGVTPEDFGQAIYGETFDALEGALVDEVLHFFPRSQRQILQKALAKGKQLAKQGEQAAVKILESDTLDKMLQANLDNLNRETEEELKAALSSAA